ncbi:MAG TPA: nuclear transport factor 2 family protein [Acidimicrobiales bacterium]|jgi:ketosteroid isomerase-like protein|nr:nuclear transport factor 2 family protein [Acidimicrobiales bacterium]
MDPWETAAREEIRELVARYTHLGDGGKIDQLVALFEPDAIFEADTAPEPLQGRAAIAGLLGGLADDHGGEVGQTYMRHNVSNLTIEFESPWVATGAAYWFVISDNGLWRWGRYRDTYRREGDGPWLFARRRVRADPQKA